MDNLRCNRLTCRRTLTEKAVVTTCSHIFCVECANELFNASRLCPACDTSLTEPDDVVVCSLHPSNDYKTSVLSGLSPVIILEICGRAMSFWQYQNHQEHSFQQAVIRNVNEKNTQLQKELNNMIREANGEISILNSKVTELEREIELERRKSATLQDSLKERDKEYQKLKAQCDKIKRKALLAPNSMGQENNPALGGLNRGARSFDEQSNRMRAGGGLMGLGGVGVDVGAVVGGMEANGIQRTPISSRIVPQGATWRPPHTVHGVQARHANPQRQPFSTMTDQSFRTSTTRSDQSDSANEVENLIGSRAMQRANIGPNNGWMPQAPPGRSNRAQPSSKRAGGGFRPAGTVG